MIDAFESDTHFRTYGMERNPSFTANCNVLSALLEQPEPERYSAQITKITDFLCNQWWESDEDIKDKWVRTWMPKSECDQMRPYQANTRTEFEQPVPIASSGSSICRSSYPR